VFDVDSDVGSDASDTECSDKFNCRGPQGCRICGLKTKTKNHFMQLGFNSSNGVTDTLESSSILLYSKLHIGLYTQRIWGDATLIKK
jgi:hypothetical protein